MEVEMLNRIFLSCLVLAVGASVVPVSFVQAEGGCTLPELTEREVLIDLLGRQRQELRTIPDTPEKDDADKKKKLVEVGNQDSLDEAIAAVEAARKKCIFKTALLPVTVPIAALGDQPLFTPEELVLLSDQDLPNGLKIGEGLEDEAMEQLLTDKGWEKVEREDPDDSAVTLVAYKRLSDGKVIAFRNVNYIVNYQKLPSLADGDADTPGDQPVNNRVAFGEPGFDDKYGEETKEVGNFHLQTSCELPAFTPAGEDSFDGGTDDRNGEAPADVSANYLMETFVTLEGEILTAMNDDPLVSEGLFQDMNDGDGIVGTGYLYVEDEFGPQVDITVAIDNDTVKQMQDFGASNANTFIIGNAKYYDNDGSGYSQAINPNEEVTPLWHWPNNASIDRNGANGDDYKWNEIAMRNNNANDERVSMTFNYEAGLSVYNRVKYLDNEGNYKYVYYIPPKKVNGTWIGPYAGRVCDSGADEGGGDDYYKVRTENQQYLENFYKPINLPKIKDPDTGEILDVKAAVDYIHDAGEGEEATVNVQNEQGSIEAASGFPHTACISVKWGRECVQGITVGGSDDPELRIPEGTLLIPTGWASARLSPGDNNVRRLESADAVIDTIPGVANGDGDSYPKTQVGTPSDGDDASDAFFKINAADCCNNDVVVASGTYGSEDNLKPNPKIVIDELDTRKGADVALRDVATVPNDLASAGDPLGTYDPDRVYYRLHDNNVPIYGSGTQGADVRGYGNFSNNAPVWNGTGTQKTLANPVDSEDHGYLDTRFIAGEPNFQEKRRHKITIMSDDNLGPQIDTNTGDVVWPMRHVSYKFYHHPSNPDASVNQEFNGTELASLQTDVEAALNGWDLMLEGTVVDVDPDAEPGDDAAWAREPLQEFEYNFPRSGRWIIRVDAVDRSENARIMLVPVDVGTVNMDMRRLDLNSSRSD
jgi:hypothetical protein